MRVSVISPESAVFDGEADSVVAPAFDGEVGILANHAPMMTVLGSGVLRVESAGVTRRFQVRGGFLQVIKNSVRVLAEHVEADPDTAK
jgi:F-type H+-transporting ATPase subunit epsilon